MRKNGSTIVLSVSKALRNLEILLGPSNPECQVISYLFHHFYRNEILEKTPFDIAQKLNLAPGFVKALMQRLVESKVLIHGGNFYFLNTDFALNK